MQIEYDNKTLYVDTKTKQAFNEPPPPMGWIRIKLDGKPAYYHVDSGTAQRIHPGLPTAASSSSSSTNLSDEEGGD